MRILKYRIGIGHNYIQIPKFSEIISFQIQNGNFTIWAKVRTEIKDSKHIFVAVTGEELPLELDGRETEGKFLGTAQDQNGFVFHAFEVVLRKDL